MRHPLRYVPWLWSLVALCLPPLGCSEDGGVGGTGAATTSGGGTGGGGGSSSGTGGVGGSTSGGGSGAATPGCPAAALGNALGRDHLMIGGSMDDTSFAAASFDIRYQYMAGNVPTGGPCTSCATGCTVDGASCANNAGCSWWGCWQYDQDPPGRFVANFLAEAAQAGAVPMISYYIWFSVAGDVEGQPEIAALTDGARVSAYLADFRFLCEVMAEDPSITSILHLEPDLWGYGHQLTNDPETLPVALSAAGEAACAGLPDTFGGLSRCLIAIADMVAPHVLIGFHASAWGAGADALSSDDPQLDVAAHAAQTASFMQALGADQGDLVVVEMSDRDAGFNNRWWDASDVTLPHFAQAIEWVAALGHGLDLAPLWWQVPYGHMGLPNVCDQYEDNRVDYVFDHPERFAEGGALGVAFGAGAGCMTTPATDGGHFVSRATEYYQSERPLLCGD